jgi:SOS-response transcriptional repressor LexA/transcriptional regulator with XRE-family HTH domain
MSIRKSKFPSGAPPEICRRLAGVREAFAGERGQARFAAMLGLTPSTWGNYEKSRVPPISLLVQVAELTGRDLRWLATGREPQEQGGSDGPHGWTSSPQHWAILKRAAALLDDRPANMPALAAFLDLLEEKTRLERERQLRAGPSSAPEVRAGPSPELRAGPSSAPVPWPDFGKWIPVFGRAAAGLARFWSELDNRPSALPPPSALDELISRAAQLSDADSRLAVFESPKARTGSAKATTEKRRAAKPLRVRLIQLSEPLTDYQLTEFLESEELAERYRPLFGLRLTGDSMAPMFPDGTIVLCSPSEPARPGMPAVVRLAGQIGLTCKIYRPRESLVRLVPANDKYEPQEFPARQLEWALAVLGSVRVG